MAGTYAGSTVHEDQIVELDKKFKRAINFGISTQTLR